MNLESATQFPSEVILAIPSQDTENWVFAALFTDDPLCRQPDYECIHKGYTDKHPAYLMTLKKYGKILKRKRGEIKKTKRCYLPITVTVTDNWDKVCEICSQAKAFNDKLAMLADSLFGRLPASRSVRHKFRQL